MKNQINHYLNSPEVTRLAKSSQDLYRHALKHLESFCDHADIPDFETFQKFMQPLVEYLEKKKLSGTSIQNYITCIKLFLKHTGCWVEFTYRMSNHEKKKKLKKHLVRWFSEKEIEQCLDYTFSNDLPVQQLTNKILIRLLIEAGARVGEIAKVEAEHIDLKEKILWIMDSKTVPRATFFSPLTHRMLIMLQERIVWSGEIFPAVRTIQKSVANMLAELGLTKNGRGPHTFRHYIATKMFYDGNMRIQDIAFIMGDKPETIANHYLHPTPEMLKRKVDEAMGWERK